MHTFKFLSIAVLMSTALMNSSEASSVRLEFDENGKCSVECDNVKKEFNSLDELSHDINSITSKYFTVDSISKIPELNTIMLQGFDNKKTDIPYKLSISGSVCFHPYVILNYMRHIPNIPNVSLDCITNLKIYSSKFTYPMSGTVEYLDLNKILFNDKPISYFNTIKTVSSENSVKSLLQNTITKCIDCSNTLFLLFLAKYITEQFGYN